MRQLTGHARQRLRSVDVATDAGNSLPTDGQGAEPLRVLIAEDEALIRMDLAEMLAESGFDVVAQLRDGRSALQRTRELCPDLVIMDIKMPGMDGISAAEVISEELIAPVVLLTAFSDKDLVERARDAGVMAYVLKPFTIQDLQPAITIARARWTERLALSAEVTDLMQSLQTRKQLDRAKSVLMGQLSIDEPAAFRWIQKAAMDRRLGMREVAETILAGGRPGESGASSPTQHS